MTEQFWGLLWSLSVRLFGARHSIARRLESRWRVAYWATRPPLTSERAVPHLFGGYLASELDGLEDDSFEEDEGLS